MCAVTGKLFSLHYKDTQLNKIKYQETPHAQHKQNLETIHNTYTELDDN